MPAGSRMRNNLHLATGWRSPKTCSNMSRVHSRDITLSTVEWAVQIPTGHPNPVHSGTASTDLSTRTPDLREDRWDAGNLWASDGHPSTPKGGRPKHTDIRACVSTPIPSPMRPVHCNLRPCRDMHNPIHCAPLFPTVPYRVPEKVQTEKRTGDWRSRRSGKPPRWSTVVTTANDSPVEARGVIRGTGILSALH